MYSRKSIVARMEPWRTPALTRYSCKDLLSRTNWSCLLLRKDKLKLKTWPEISSDLSLWRRPGCYTLSKAWDILCATAWVAPHLLKSLAILPDTTVRRSAVEHEDQNHTGNQEKDHISQGE